MLQTKSKNTKYNTVEKKFEDTKGTTRNRKSKNRPYNYQKVPKGQPEAVNQRRTDNTIVNIKGTKGKHSKSNRKMVGPEAKAITLTTDIFQKEYAQKPTMVSP